MSPAVRDQIPRLPLDGKLDLTYRCNNTCRHCWLWLPPEASEGRDELSLAEIRRIVDEARAMGCRSWGLSGGEPMLRPDFGEILDYITRKSAFYSLNTNGTLITPALARLLARRGRKMVALYGATAEVHDRVTRNPGSFEATMRGMAYLREAGAGFTVQVIPMAESAHEYTRMLDLAASLSRDYRVGAGWLYLSANGSAGRNREIARQRVAPATVLLFDEPDVGAEVMAGQGAAAAAAEAGCAAAGAGDDRLYAACIAARREFHVDPYGTMSFCGYIKDPALRFDLRRGPFREAWDEFIPGLAETVRGGDEYRENCGSCELRRDCHWCAVYGYLEHGRHSARVEYLCQIAAETGRFREEWKLTHVRYYQIAGITIQLVSDRPLTRETFTPALAKFEAAGPGEDMIAVRLFSSVPRRSELNLGREVYRHAPWTIYRQGQGWVYVVTSGESTEGDPCAVGIFSETHDRGTVYQGVDFLSQGGANALTTLTTDQVLLGRVLAERRGCLLHSAGIVVDGKGLVFVGHSEAGKSTMMKMLRERGEILCDDRIIVRRWPDGFKIYGTWSNGELPDVSPASAPLHAIMFLEKATTNEVIPVTSKAERLGLLLSHVVKPLATADWWEKTLDVIGQLATEAPIYRLRFDKSGAVAGLLDRL